MKLFSALELQYNRLDGAIRKYLTEKLGSAVSGYSSANIFGMILNVIRGICQNLMLYIEDVAQEQNIETAVRRSSIASLARQAGYEPFYGYAASGTVTLQLLPNNGAAASRVVIPNGTKVTHVKTGKFYIMNLPMDYYTVQLGNSFQPVSIPLVEGNWINAGWSAHGIPLESFSVNIVGFYDINHVTVKVNGKKWERYACLYDMNADSEGYVISQAFDGLFQVVFGNGVHGRMLYAGDSVQCSYIRHTGSNGNLLISDDNEFVFSSGIKDAEGNEIDGNDLFSIKTEHIITGGMDAESISNVRQMMGYNSRSLVLANADNFKLFLSRFSFIGHCNVWSEQNNMTINIAALTNAETQITEPGQYFSLTVKDMLLTEEQKNLVRQTIDRSKQAFAGATIEFVDPILRNFALIVYVKVSPHHDKITVSENIKTSAAEFFMSLRDDTQFIPKSDLIKHLLDNVDGVISIDLSFVSEANETGFVKGTYNVYKQVWINGIYQNQVITRTWTPADNLCEDQWGNISLSSYMEFPVLLGGFRYYPEKNNPFNSVLLDAVQIYFV